MLNSVVNHIIFFPQKLSILQVKSLLMPIWYSAFHLFLYIVTFWKILWILFDLPIHDKEITLDFEVTSLHLTYINSPHLHQFTSHTSIHLTYINSPHIHKFTSLTSIHLTYINSPHLHQFTSLTPIHLTYINSPHLHQFTSHTSTHLTYINSPHLHQFTSLTSIHLTYIRAGAISTMEKALDEYVVNGLGNNIPFLRSVYRNEK